MIVTAAAAVALFRRGAVLGFYPLERLLHFVLWLMPTAGVALNRLDLPIMPVVILLFGLVAWLRLPGRGQSRIAERRSGGLKPQQFKALSQSGGIHGR